MKKMELRKWLFFKIYQLRGQPVETTYYRFLQQIETGIPTDTTKNLLGQLLFHCRASVPYYAKIMDSMGDGYIEDPETYLINFPILTKDIIRDNFDELKSSDLHARHWFNNTSGGSTGDPVRFIQDRNYSTLSGAVSLLFSKLVGREVGEYEIRFWGSIRDVKRGTTGWRAQLINLVNNTFFFNSVLMTPDRILEFVQLINTKKPKLIIAYVEPLYEVAKYIERENITVTPQTAIMTAAGKLYPFMREKISSVFQCQVFDNYGSREVGGIACERPGLNGLWVAPWGNYLEVVDEQGNRVPDGVEGDILVTSLSNYAMPFIRYRIGDRGILSPQRFNLDRGYGQVLEEVTGRTMDIFKTQNGNLINPGYFMAMLYFRDWISQYQIIQTSYSGVTYKILKRGHPPQGELEEIELKTKAAMGEACQVNFEFVDEIQPANSGKYRYLISQVQSN